MSTDWLILAFVVGAGILALLWARHTSRRVHARLTRLDAQIEQRNNAQKIGQLRSLAAMISDESERGQLLIRIEQAEKERVCTGLKS